MGIGPIGFNYTPLESVLNQIGPQLVVPHRHEYFEIIWFTSGSGTHFVEFASYEIIPDTLIFLGRDQIHAFREIAGMQGHMLRFSEKFIAGYFAETSVNMPYTLFDATSPPLRILPSEKRCRFSSLMEHIRYETGVPAEPRHTTMLLHLLHVFLHEAERLETGEQRMSPARCRSMQTYNRFFALLEQHYSYEQRVRFYAESLGLAPKRLNELCQEVTALSAKKIIEERVILEAKRYLLHSDLSIKEIGYRLGFEDPAYFTRAFTRITSLPPTVFRGQQDKKYK